MRCGGWRIYGGLRRVGVGDGDLNPRSNQTRKSGWLEMERTRARDIQFVCKTVGPLGLKSGVGVMYDRPYDYELGVQRRYLIV